MTRHWKQPGLGLVLAMIVFVLVGQAFPDSENSLSAALLDMSIAATVSFAIGGFVARERFLFPAVVLALVVWITNTGISLSYALDLGNSVWEQFVWSLPNLVLIPAVAFGAIVGMLVAKKLRGQPQVL